MELQRPYLLFLGDVADQLAAKTAQGINDWRPEWCLGQYRLPNCKADLGIPDMSLEEAYEHGARTLVLGVANRGGVFSPQWIDVILKAIEIGMDVATGLHSKLTDVPEIAETAAKHSRNLFDLRHPTQVFDVANGAKRPGKRMLAVGTDCSIGKMYTALAVEREMKARGLNASFRATGQTGIFIAGSGVSIDAVVADFISGAVEWLCPANSPDHWDLVEGQGSLFHPSFAGVTMGLIHGAQPDALVLCHEPTRTHMRGLPHYGLPDVQTTIETAVAHARLVNPAATCIGMAINTKALGESEAENYLAEMEQKHGLPAVDPVRTGVARLVDAMAEI
ncbi:MAG: N-acetyltransferase DgcN [Kiloniellales bacterium]